MDEQKQQLLQKLMQEHPELNEKLKELHAYDSADIKEKIIALIKEYGVELTAEELKFPVSELKDDELKAVAGGKFTTQYAYLSGRTGFMDRHSISGLQESE
ncbi:MAG: hypothetical protein ACI4XA_01030 [Oscillospiraceae bacterium]